MPESANGCLNYVIVAVNWPIFGTVWIHMAFFGVINKQGKNNDTKFKLDTDIEMN